MPITWNGEHAENMVAGAAAEGMREATETLLALAVDQTPWVEHHLRNSGEADVEVDGDTVRGTVSFNTPYARRQHEELTFNHPNGGNAKFLERPANGYADELERILAHHVRQALA